VFVVTVLLGLALHLFGTLAVLIRTLAGVSPLRFFGKVRDVMITGFSTSSSNATLPTSLAAAEHELRLPSTVAGFVVPLGAIGCVPVIVPVGRNGLDQDCPIDLSLFQTLEQSLRGHRHRLNPRERETRRLEGVALPIISNHMDVSIHHHGVPCLSAYPARNSLSCGGILHQSSYPDHLPRWARVCTPYLAIACTALSLWPSPRS